VTQNRAVLRRAQPRGRLRVVDLLGAHDLALVDELREQLRLRKSAPVFETLARQRAEDLSVGVEDRAVRVPEGTRFDLCGAQDEDSV
jgi:hypothetical protein